jgi:hypothetical protein
VIEVAGGNGRRLEVDMPLDAKRVPQLGEADEQLEDRRIGTPEVDREPLAHIPVTPHFDKAEDAVKMGGRKASRGSTTDADDA